LAKSSYGYFNFFFKIIPHLKLNFDQIFLWMIITFATSQIWQQSFPKPTKKEKKKDNNIYNLQEEIMSWKYTLITWDGHKSDV